MNEELLKNNNELLEMFKKVHQEPFNKTDLDSYIAAYICDFFSFVITAQTFVDYQGISSEVRNIINNLLSLKPKIMEIVEKSYQDFLKF